MKLPKLNFFKETWFGAVVGGCVGWMIVNNVPIVLGVLARETTYDVQALGALASIEVLGMALGVFAAAWYVPLFKSSVLVRILALAHAASYFALVIVGDNYIGLAINLFLVGFTGGGLISVALAAMARFANSERAIALFNGVAQAISALYSPLLTFSEGLSGLAGMWSFVGITALLILPATFLKPGQDEALKVTPIATPTPMREVFADWKKFSVFIGIMFFGLGIYMPYAFAERMGSQNGLDAAYISLALGIGTLVSIPVSTWFGFISHKLQRHTGLLLGVVMVFASALVFVYSGNDVAYTVAASGIQSGWSIIWIVCLGAMAAIDRSGRLVVLGYFVFKLSYAIAPVAGGAVAVSVGYPILVFGAGALLAFAYILLGVAERGARRQVVPHVT